MIIGLFGRSKSGKHILAEECEKRGFIVLAFASALKNMVSELVGFTVDSRQETKDKVVNLVLSKEQLEFVSEVTNISLSTVKDVLGGYVFNRVRDLLQIIGTDLIRRNNPNWHVEELKKLIEDGKNYVIDDGRFKNEKEMIESIGGKTVFVVRPYIPSTFSNHESEISVKWQDFKHVFVNDENVEAAKLKWSKIYNKLDERYKFLEENKGYEGLKNIFNHYGVNVSHALYLINNVFGLSLCQFLYDDCYFENSKIRRCYPQRSNDNLHTMQVEMEDSIGELETVTNPLMIEDLKMYL